MKYALLDDLLTTRTTLPYIPRYFGDILENKKEVEIPKHYIINENATILFWKDGSKTIVKRAKDDEFDPVKGFLWAFFQKYCGMSRNKANKYLANLEIENPKFKKESKLNLKVGDQVTVKKTIIPLKDYGGKRFMPSMEEFKDKKVTIAHLNEKENCYYIEEDNKRWSWTEEMFKIKKPKHMEENK